MADDDEEVMKVDLVAKYRELGKLFFPHFPFFLLGISLKDDAIKREKKYFYYKKISHIFL